MKLNIAASAAEAERAKAEGKALPEFGPLPPVSAICDGSSRFMPATRSSIRRRSAARGPLASRPGWSILELVSEAHDKDGALVMSFDSAAMIRFPEDHQAG